jgi:hypothetical protein
MQHSMFSIQISKRVVIDTRNLFRTQSLRKQQRKYTWQTRRGLMAEQLAWNIFLCI